MNERSESDINQLENQLQSLINTVKALAEQEKNNSQNLLVLLRALEQLHKEIREQLFEPSLPNTRKDLYNLLKDIDDTGGWPYIERMRLKTLLAKWLAESNPGENDPLSISEKIDPSQSLNF